jgi:hypothetical protein
VGPDPPPPVVLDGAHRLGTLASATSGFRDQFYGLSGAVVDEPDGDRPKLVTCGVIDPARCDWGARPVRFARRRWAHPRVDIDALAPPLRRWVDDRLVPKVVLATQTRILEAAIDHDGSWVPSTPVIAVHGGVEDLPAIASVLLAPPVSAWAMTHYGGTALASDAIKLSAKQVGTIPLPTDDEEWRQGAVAVAAGDLEAGAGHMTAAYGCDPAVTGWWTNRWRPV